MLSILLYLLFACIVIGMIFYVLSILPIPQPWLNLAKVIVCVIVLIWLLMWLLPLAGGSLHPLLR